MAVRFTVLGSGSTGNASLLEANGFGLLLDVGLGAKQIASRLEVIDRSWRDVHAVLLTHTHADHWNPSSLAQLGRRRIRLYLHATHARRLRSACAAFENLRSLRLLRPYSSDRTFLVGPAIRCRPLSLSHDEWPTFGFRIDGDGDLFSDRWSLAYVADAGSWNGELAASCADADLFALEFNHDVAMQHSSGRSPRLIARILGDSGHLSNDQAATLLAEVLQRSQMNPPRYLVQLHLSGDCNRPIMALRAARDVLDACGSNLAVHIAHPDKPSCSFLLGARQVSDLSSRQASG